MNSNFGSMRLTQNANFINPSFIGNNGMIMVKAPSQNSHIKKGLTSRDSQKLNLKDQSIEVFQKHHQKPQPKIINVAKRAMPLRTNIRDQRSNRGIIDGLNEKVRLQLKKSQELSKSSYQFIAS